MVPADSQPYAKSRRWKDSRHRQEFVMRIRFFKVTFIALCGLVSPVTLWPFSASAQETAARSQSGDVAQPSPRPTGRGVGLGVDNGVFGRAYEHGLRFRIPILEHWAVNLRGLSVLGERADELHWYLGGRLDVVGHGPVYLNLVRLYGGGGPEVLARVQGSTDEKVLIGFGGHFGVEFFLNPKMSFFTEIGGHSGNDLTAGGTALAGLILYPFSGP
jgi:hypothetical protein